MRTHNLLTTPGDRGREGCGVALRESRGDPNFFEPFTVEIREFHVVTVTEFFFLLDVKIF